MPCKICTHNKECNKEQRENCSKVEEYFNERWEAIVKEREVKEQWN